MSPELREAAKEMRRRAQIDIESGLEQPALLGSAIADLLDTLALDPGKGYSFDATRTTARNLALVILKTAAAVPPAHGTAADGDPTGSLHTSRSPAPGPVVAGAGGNPDKDIDRLLDVLSRWVFAERQGDPAAAAASEELIAAFDAYLLTSTSTPTWYPVACPHGYDHCPECDAGTVPAPASTMPGPSAGVDLGDDPDGDNTAGDQIIADH